MKFLFFLLPALLFLGCSNKINLADYRPYYVPKNSAAPSNFSPKIKKISMVKFPKYRFRHVDVSSDTFYTLKNLLSSSRFVKILRVITPDKINEEVKAAEISKETDSDLGADYIIKGRIVNVTYTPFYHKGYYYYIKTKNGKKLKYSPPYYSYEACTQLHIDVLALPDLNNALSENFQACSSFSDTVSYKRFYPNLIIKSSSKAAEYAYSSLKRFFAPKGYIYEVKTDGDDLIAKITLGKNQGMYEGLKLNIYRLQKDPVTGEIEKYKIGEGTVSNIIFDNSCWIKTDLNDNAKLEIGDMVIPDFNTSFWDLF